MSESTNILTGEVVNDNSQSVEIGKIAKSLAQAQGQMSGVKKNQVNPFHKNQYADLNSCLDACRELLSKNEIALIQTNEICTDGVIVVTKLVHSSGQWFSGKLFIPLTKKDAQGVGSAITYGRRYALTSMVGIAQADDDGNSISVNTSKPSGAQMSTGKKTQIEMASSKQIDTISDMLNNGQFDDDVKKKGLRKLKSGTMTKAQASAWISKNSTKAFNGTSS